MWCSWTVSMPQRLKGWQLLAEYLKPSYSIPACRVSINSHAGVLPLAGFSVLPLKSKVTITNQPIHGQT